MYRDSGYVIGIWNGLKFENDWCTKSFKFTLTAVQIWGFEEPTLAPYERRANAWYKAKPNCDRSMSSIVYKVKKSTQFSLRDLRDPSDIVLNIFHLFCTISVNIQLVLLLLSGSKWFTETHGKSKVLWSVNSGHVSAWERQNNRWNWRDNNERLYAGMRLLSFTLFLSTYWRNRTAQKLGLLGLCSIKWLKSILLDGWLPPTPLWWYPFIIHHCGWRGTLKSRVKGGK